MGLLNKPALIWAYAEWQELRAAAGASRSHRWSRASPKREGLWPISPLSGPRRASQQQSIFQSLAPLSSPPAPGFYPPNTSAAPHHAPSLQPQPSCCPEPCPDPRAYAADSESSQEHPRLEGPQTHLQHPVEIEYFRTFTKAWSTPVGEEDLGQLPYPPKTPTSPLYSCINYFILVWLPH